MEAFLEPMLTMVISHCENVSVVCALCSVLLKAELKKRQRQDWKNNRKTSLEDTNQSLTDRHDHRNFQIPAFMRRYLRRSQVNPFG